MSGKNRSVDFAWIGKMMFEFGFALRFYKKIEGTQIIRTKFEFLFEFVNIICFLITCWKHSVRRLYLEFQIELGYNEK